MATTITRVLLDFRTPAHFGRRGIGLNETDMALPADSLFSALCTLLARLEGTSAVTALLSRFPVFGQPSTYGRVPPLRLTSLMPTANGIDFLPMPILHPKLPGASIEIRKEIKGIAWVSTTIFQKLIAGTKLAEDDTAIDRRAGQREQPFTVQGGEVWVTRDEQATLGGPDRPLWKVETRPRVTVDRRTSASAAFSSGSVLFTRNKEIHAGLYALVQWKDQGNDLKDTIEAVFTALGDEGVGGERSIGLGHFQPSFGPVAEILGAREGEYFTTLSPYLPQPVENAVFDDNARYSITLRRGWSNMPGHTTLRRPTIRMVNTGAVLKQPESGAVTGCLADATPTIAAGTMALRRYGIAWPVPVAAAALQES